jgi:carbonic anhydrase
MTRLGIARLCLLLLVTPLFCQVSDPCPGSNCPGCTYFSPSDPWGELSAGFGRYLACARGGRVACGPRRDKCTRCCGLDGQKPFAVVLSCSDSRVPPEILFDQGLGDLFVVRVAGNVASDEAIGSVEYAIAHLKGVKLIVVLGHQECGAVKAALEPTPAHDMLPSFLNRIYPVVADKGWQPDKPEDVVAAVKANVTFTAKLLRQYSPIIRNGYKGLPPPEIKGAYYSISKGEIETVISLPPEIQPRRP